MQGMIPFVDMNQVLCIYTMHWGSRFWKKIIIFNQRLMLIKYFSNLLQIPKPQYTFVLIVSNPPLLSPSFFRST
jgi:hypothetical protein